MSMRPSDKLIPWYFVLFFLVVFAVNGVFVYIAAQTHTGVVSDQAYVNGLAYNETLEAAAKQEALGWEASLTLEESTHAVRLSLKDKEGAAIEGADVLLHLTRPTTDGYDSSLAMTEAAAGVYQAQPTFPLKGQWQLRAVVTQGDTSYQTSALVVVK